MPLIIDCDPGQDDALMLMLALGAGDFFGASVGAFFSRVWPGCATSWGARGVGYSGGGGAGVNGAWVVMVGKNTNAGWRSRGATSHASIRASAY